MSILALGLNHRTAPVTLRERFAFAETRIPEALQRLHDSGVAEEVVILSTCNRVEIYAVTRAEPKQAFQNLVEFLTACHDYNGPLTREIYQLTEPQSLQHLFRVAAGMDSMVLGETEILGQLKKAYELALKHKSTGGFLNKAFQGAFHVAKQIRTETNIQRGSVSVGSVAVELAQHIFSRLDNRQVMVIGAGETSEKTARALLSRGARSIIVSNRSFDRAEALARELGGRAVQFEDWADPFKTIDIVISSTAAPHHILDREKLAAIMKQRHQEPLLLIDIAVPRDIDPEVNRLDNVYLYNIDDLQAIADDCLRQRQEELARCECIIDGKVRALLEGRKGPNLSAPNRPAFSHD